MLRRVPAPFLRARLGGWRLPSPITLSPRMLTPMALAAALLLWASSFPGITVALAGYSPPELALLRYVVASGMLLAYALYRRMPLPRPRDVPGLMLVGFLGFTVYNIALNAGQQTVSAGVASFIVSSEVAMIALLASVFYGERLGGRGWAGLAVSMIGITAISTAADDGYHISAGALLLVLAMLRGSLYSVLGKPFLRRYDAVQFTSYVIWAGTLFMVPFAPGAFGAVAAAPTPATLSLVYLGVFPGIIAFMAWSYVLSQIPAAHAGSYLATIPVATVMLAWWWLGEVPTTAAAVGGVIVLAGVALVNSRTG